VYLAPDDAKSDVILAGVVVVFGGAIRGFVSSLPLYPQRGLLLVALDLLWIIALTGLVPILLARYRGDGAQAFGLTGQGGAVGGGLVLALPVIVLGVVTSLRLQRDPLSALLGRVGAVATADPLDVVIQVVAVLLLASGVLVLIGFLATRGRDGFPRSPEASLTQLLRTIGMGSAAVALVLGLLRAFGPGDPIAVVLNVAALVAVLLLADRLVPAQISLPRATVLAPVVVVVVAQVFAAGGLFRGDLLTALYLGALGGGVAVALAVLSQTRVGIGAGAATAVAIHWWPTCLSPVPFATGVC
jgi:hypothetical protein